MASITAQMLPKLIDALLSIKHDPYESKRNRALAAKQAAQFEAMLDAWLQDKPLQS